MKQNTSREKQIHGHSTSLPNLHLSGIRRRPQVADDVTLRSIHSMMRTPTKRYYDDLFSLSLLTRTEDSGLPPLKGARHRRAMEMQSNAYNKLECESGQSEIEVLKEIDKFERKTSHKYFNDLQKINSEFEFSKSNFRGIDSDMQIKILNRKFPNRFTANIPDVEMQNKLLAETTRARLAKKNDETKARKHAVLSKKYETDLTTQYQAIKQEIEEINERRTYVRNKIIDTNQKLSRQKSEMEDFRQMYAQSLKEPITFKARATVTLHEIPKHGISFLRKAIREMDDQPIQDRKSLENLKQFKEEKHKDLISQIKDKVTSYLTEVKFLDAKYLETKRHLVQVKEAQLTHYSRLLKEGRDTRSEGLMWIVKTLWRLGEAVPTESFPQFLDDDSVHCILFLSQKSMEIEALLERAKQMQDTICDPHYRSKLPTYAKKNNIDARLRQIKKANIIVKRPVLNFDSVKQQQPEQVLEDVVEEAESPYAFNRQATFSLNSIQDTQIIEDTIAQIRQLISQAQQGELERINKEFFIENYEERYGVTLKDVCACIIGHEAVDRKLGNLSKQRREMVEKIEKTKTFAFSSKQQMGSSN